MDPSAKPQPSMPETFTVGMNHAQPSDLNCGAQIAFVHALKDSELNYEKHRHNVNMQMLRKNEGIHAPLKMAMEMQATRKVGRLPFLQSSNAAFDALTGRDELLDFSDFLGTQEFNEVSRQPHAVVEKSLGIL